MLVGVAGLVIIIALAVAASSNREDCEKMTCPSGQKPKLLKHECLCVQPAKNHGGRP